MIRILTENDRNIWLELTGEFYSSDAVDHSIPEKFRDTTFSELMRGSPYAEGIILECDGETAGYALFAVTFSQEAGGKTVWIEEAYVREAYRSRGLGKEVFSWAEKRWQDAVRFRLEVEDDNTRAIKLYSSLGYKNLPYSQMIKDKV